MIDAGMEQVAFNPGASFRGIHDSLVHTDGAPQVVLCLHEAVSVAVAQGYAKAAGKPMAALLHDVVGLQHGEHGDLQRVVRPRPVLSSAARGRSRGAPAALDRLDPHRHVQAELVRDYVKWDDEPHDMLSVPESFARAYTASRAEPAGPVYLCYDFDLQEDPLPGDYEAEPLSSFPVPSTPVAPAEDLDFMADALRAAERPAIIAGYTNGSAEAMAALGSLAELLGAPVVDKGMRLALPTGHPLNAGGTEDVLEEADVLLALDVDELRGPLGLKQTATLLNVSLGHLRLRGWAHDYQPLQPAARNVTAHADSVVAGLLGRLREEPPPGESASARRDALVERIASARASRIEAAATAEADGCVRSSASCTSWAGRLRVSASCSPTAPTSGSSTGSGTSVSPGSTSAGMPAVAWATEWAPPSAPRSRLGRTRSA